MIHTFFQSWEGPLAGVRPYIGVGRAVRGGKANSVTSPQSSFLSSTAITSVLPEVSYFWSKDEKSRMIDYDFALKWARWEFFGWKACGPLKEQIKNKWICCRVLGPAVLIILLWTSCLHLLLVPLPLSASVLISFSYYRPASSVDPWFLISPHLSPHKYTLIDTTLSPSSPNLNWQIPSRFLSSHSWEGQTDQSSL